MNAEALPAAVRAAFEADARVDFVVEYLSGYVPNSYRWKATGKSRKYVKATDGSFTVTDTTYERKRTGGRGPAVVGFSAAGGRLVSA